MGQLTLLFMGCPYRLPGMTDPFLALSASPGSRRQVSVPVPFREAEAGHSPGPTPMRIVCTTYSSSPRSPVPGAGGAPRGEGGGKGDSEFWVDALAGFGGNPSQFWVDALYSTNSGATPSSINTSQAVD